ARLKPGVSLDQATAEMATIARRLEQEHPASQKEWSARAVSLREDMASDVGPYFWILMGAVGLVLLVSCANLAGLMLARAARRQREMAIRVAVGAGRGRLVRQLLTESIVVALLGGTAGLLLALWTVDLVSTGTAGRVPYWIEFGIDGRVLAFCATATLLTGILFGLAPALRASRPDLHEALKEGAPPSSPGRHRLRVTLVIAEVALALVLLNAAGVTVKAVLRVTEPPAGYDSRGLLQADMEYLSDRFADSGAVAEAAGEIVRRLDAAPGVRAAARHTWFIAGFGARDQKIAVEGLSEVPDGASPRFGFAVTPGYFETLGLELVAGRTFEAGDGAGAAPVAVINRTMAGALWPGGSPLGRRIRLGGPGSGLPWVTVVGVVSNENGKPRAGQRPRSDVYLPLAQNPGRPVQFLVRGSRNHDQLAPLLRASVLAVAPDEPVERIQTAEAAIAQRFWPWRAMATMLTAFAVFAVVLAMIGIYGVVAYAVSQRRQEIGVRMALGERRERIVGLIVADGARMVGAGIIVGLIISLMVTRVMRSLLFGSNPVDPAVIAGVALLLAIAATVASWLPALKATRVDPMATLRTE
ncbi:MAG: FtsX-like permease family protein, partial [Gemmatimonadales bacterium]